MSHPLVGLTIHVDAMGWGGIENLSEEDQARLEGNPPYYHGTVREIDYSAGTKPVRWALDGTGTETGWYQTVNWLKKHVVYNDQITCSDDIVVKKPSGGTKRKPSSAKRAPKGGGKGRAMSDKTNAVEITPVRASHLNTWEYGMPERKPSYTIDEMPAMKRQPLPEAELKKNQRTWSPSACAVDILPRACTSKKCKLKCDTIAMEHKKSVRKQVLIAYEKGGMHGERTLLDALTTGTYSML